MLLPCYLLLSLLLASCADPVEKEATPPGWCEGATHGRYDIDAPQTLDVFPDETWSVADAATATGRRLALTNAMQSFPDNYAGLAAQLDTLDGFGLSAAIYLRFDAPLDPTVADDVRVLALTPEGPLAWTVDVSFLDAGATIVMTPRTPFPAATPMVAAILTDPSTSDCISPADTLRAQLWPEVSGSRHAEALDALGVAPEEVAALTVFTTQSLAAEEAILADISAGAYVFSDATCTDNGTWRYCDGTVVVNDYRDASRVVPDASGTPQSTYALPVGVWLPPGEGPFPVAMCGHGLGGSRGQCDFLADLEAPLGNAVIATDAIEHGDHPARSDTDSELLATLALFGVSMSGAVGLDALVLRDNFRATAWDRLQVLQAVHAGLDADGDGSVDLDAAHIVYAGVSLGGIMGPQVLAGDPSISAGALVVPGGSLFSIVTESPSLGILVDLMKPVDYTDDDVTRTIQILQVIVDAGDPLVHAAVLAERRDGGVSPHLMEMVAVNDEIVPNISSARLGQAYVLPGVGIEYFSIPGITFAAGDVSANLSDGKTGGLVLCAEIQMAEGADFEPADHSYLHESVQGIAAMRAFLEPALRGETPTVLDVCSP